MIQCINDITAGPKQLKQVELPVYLLGIDWVSDKSSQFINLHVTDFTPCQGKVALARQFSTGKLISYNVNNELNLDYIYTLKVHKVKVEQIVQELGIQNYKHRKSLKFFDQTIFAMAKFEIFDNDAYLRIGSLLQISKIKIQKDLKVNVKKLLKRFIKLVSPELSSKVPTHLMNKRSSDLNVFKSSKIPSGEALTFQQQGDINETQKYVERSEKRNLDKPANSPAKSNSNSPLLLSNSQIDGNKNNINANKKSQVSEEEMKEIERTWMIEMGLVKDLPNISQTEDSRKSKSPFANKVEVQQNEKNYQSSPLSRHSQSSVNTNVNKLPTQITSKLGQSPSRSVNPRLSQSPQSSIHPSKPPSQSSQLTGSQSNQASPNQLSYANPHITSVQLSQSNQTHLPTITNFNKPSSQSIKSTESPSSQLSQNQPLNLNHPTVLPSQLPPSEKSSSSNENGPQTSKQQVRSQVDSEHNLSKASDKSDDILSQLPEKHVLPHLTTAAGKFEILSQLPESQISDELDGSQKLFQSHIDNESSPINKASINRLMNQSPSSGHQDNEENLELKYHKELSFFDEHLINKITLKKLYEIPDNLLTVQQNYIFEVDGYIRILEPLDNFMIKPFKRTLKLSNFKLILIDQIKSTNNYFIELEFSTADVCKFLKIQELEEVMSHFKFIVNKLSRVINSNLRSNLRLTKKAFEVNGYKRSYWTCLNTIDDLNC